MSNTQCATEPELADPYLVQGPSLVQNASEARPRLLKGLLIGFAATVTLGLALASWYVGVRIVDAKEALPVRPTADLYLQVTGLGPRQNETFAKTLEAKGYRARIVEGRILIGPFASRTSTEEAERKLQSDGVLALEAPY
jgi:hypothetical protein